jgi:hypothetical protein
MPEIPVHVGNMLESQLKQWQSGSQHPVGIGEYISNADDSYRRLKKFDGQEIYITISSRTGKMIHKLTIEDKAEGMSKEDIENKFLQYFDSHSGRDTGALTSGQFGTGGKAYAVMNYRHCWIVSRKDGFECKVLFKYDTKNQKLIYDFDNGGYINRPTDEPNGTKIILEDSYQVKSKLEVLADLIESSPRIRHVLKNQKVFYNIERKGKSYSTTLSYKEPSDEDATKLWEFSLPKSLSEISGNGDVLRIKYFEQELPKDKNIIDVSDGITSVADYQIKIFDNRSFAKLLFGTIQISKLIDSHAVKENRKGLEEGHDLTVEIESLLKEKIREIVDELEEYQKKKEKLERQAETNKKLNELSKFLNKQNLNFKLQINQLKKKFLKSEQDDDQPNPRKDDGDIIVYRKPIEEDSPMDIIKGRWVVKTNGEGGGKEGTLEFIPDETGADEAVRADKKKSKKLQPIKQKLGIQVLMSNDEGNPESPVLSEFEEPIFDRDLERKGIIWVNTVHPLIKSTRESKNALIFLETVSNFVLVSIAQYFAQKELEVQPESEFEDPFIIFRRYYFKLQKEIRLDESLNYFESE